MDDEFDQGDMSPREDADLYDEETKQQIKEKTFLTEHRRN